MKISARVVIPITTAVLLAGVILGYAWWQLSGTQFSLQQRVKALAEKQDQLQQSGSGAIAPSDAPVDAGDIVLVHLRQGDVLSLQGDWAGAEKEYQASVDAGGGVPALRKLAQAQLQRREIADVKQTIQELRRLGARDEDLLLLDVIVNLRTGEVAAAEQELSTAPDSPQKHYGTALLSIIQGNNDQAKKELALVLNGWDPTLRSYARTLQAAYDEFALFPESPPIHLTTLLSRALAQVQECELALPLLGDVVQKQADYRDAWTVQGYCEFTTERYPEALNSFEKAYAIDPEKPEIQYFLGRTYMMLQQWTNAETFLQYALANGFDPQKEVRARLAEAAMQANDPPVAYAQYAALLSEPDADLALFQKTVALAISLGKPQDAQQYAQAALKKWPDSPDAQKLVAEAQRAPPAPSSASSAPKK